MSYDNVGGFNHRRKRNIDLSTFRNKEIDLVTGIQWGNEPAPEHKIESDWEEDDSTDGTTHFPVRDSVKPQPFSARTNDSNQTIYLDGKPIRFQGTGNEKTFEESHIRFTSYLENDLFKVVKALKKQGHIRSITELVNESIKHYLTCNHS